VPRLGEVVGGLEALRLTAHKGDAAVDLVELLLADDLRQLGPLAGQAETDDTMEVLDGRGRNAQVVRGSIRAVARLPAVLARVVEGRRLLGACLVDTRGDSE